MNKLLASDIDGTLLVGGDLSKENIEAVRKFRAAGNLFMLCTGRTPASVLQFLQKYPDLECDGAILAGGGALYSNKGAVWEPIERRFLNEKAALEMITYVRDAHPNFTAHWSDGENNFSLPGRSTERHKANPPKEITLPEWKNLNRPTLIAVFSSMEQDETKTVALRNIVRQKWGAHFEAHHNGYYLDVSALGCNKKYGFTRMARLMGGLPAYAVGDGFNDAPMFEGAGKTNSFLMESGAKPLLPKVRRTVRSVAECIDILING